MALNRALLRGLRKTPGGNSLSVLARAFFLPWVWAPKCLAWSSVGALGVLACKRQNFENLARQKSAAENAPAAFAGQEKVSLTVALFPFVPDVSTDNLEGFYALLEASFERENPNVDLRLVPRGETNPYNSHWLAAQNSDALKGADVFEMDSTAFDLLPKGHSQPWPTAMPQGSTFRPAGEVWQMSARHVLPTRLCSYFVFHASGLLGEPKRLVGDLSGSMGLPAFYLLARGPFLERDLGSTDLVEDAVGHVRTFARHCEMPPSGATLKEGVGHPLNPCLEGAYANDSQKPHIREFLFKEADGIFGYPELAAEIVKPHSAGFSADNLSARIVKFGDNNSGRAYVNGLVLSAKCQANCATAAVNFAQFFLRTETQAYFMLGMDSRPPRPRYLVPAYADHAKVPGVYNNPLYRTLIEQLAQTNAFPLTGMAQFSAKNRSQLRQVLLSGSGHP